MGYIGQSMSENAAAAYERGERPLSKWTKSELTNQIEENIESGELKLNCNLEELKKWPAELLREHCLRYTASHHMGKYYELIAFYELDIDELESLTDEMLKNLYSDYREKQKIEKQKKAEESKEAEVWECTYLEWYGSRKHPKANEIREIGVIKGNWFYCLGYGHRKKSIYANGFVRHRQITNFEEEVGEELKEIKEIIYGKVKKTPEEIEAERIRREAEEAERIRIEAEKAQYEEKKNLFKYQKKWKNLDGFMKSERVSFYNLRKARKKKIAEKREKLRKIWERQGYDVGLSKLDNDEFIERYIK